MKWGRKDIRAVIAGIVITDLEQYHRDTRVPYKARTCCFLFYCHISIRTIHRVVQLRTEVARLTKGYYGQPSNLEPDNRANGWDNREDSEEDREEGSLHHIAQVNVRVRN